MSIKEIARRTGASQATVSRVLNNPEHRCSDPKLRDKIWKADMELHYVPNEAARDLKNKKQGDKKQTYYIQVLVQCFSWRKRFHENGMRKSGSQSLGRRSLTRGQG